MWTYSNPVAIHAGEDALAQLPALVGDRRVLLVAFPQAPALGLVDRVQALLGDRLIAQDRLLTSGQLTDTYLLALAVSNGGRLATFDRRLAPDAVKGGKAALHLITA